MEFLSFAAQNVRLEAQAYQLSELDRVKSRFFQDVAHELRTPLTLTIGPLEDVREQLGAGTGPRTAGALDMALRNARRLLRLVNQILDTARIESGHMRLEPRDTDLAGLVRGVAAEFAGAADGRGITLEVAGPAGPISAAVDPDAIEKVITNLLANAFNHSPDGGRIGVRVETGEDGGREDVALVTVEDSGPGIAPEHLPRVFDRFYRGDVSGPGAGAGSGIGLALARELVELHDGRIEAGNRPEGGAVFTFAAPLRADEARAGAAPEEVDGAPPTGPADLLDEGGSPPDDATATDAAENADVTTILVVDDNADLRAWMHDHFSRRYRVLQAADGRQALELARTALPDLVVSDVMMPHLDGHALLEALRASDETDFIPVILLTAQAGRKQRLVGLGVGADDYVAKPFDMRELEARVDNLIASRRRLRERFGSGTVELTPREAVVSDPDRRFLERLRAAIAESIADPGFGVAELARATFRDRTHLFRRTRELLGEAPSELIRRLRLEHAARLLATEELSVAEVAYTSGFNSTAYFCRVFRQAHGLTPSAHRERARQG